MKLSIVTTLYESELYVHEFHKRISKVARTVSEDYDIIYVNDGSEDNSLYLAIELSKIDEHVLVIDFSRNFGHHKAMMTGLSYAKGEKVFLIDVDLEEPPELLESFWKKMDLCGCDVVYGVQKSRKGGWFERASGYVYYKLLNIFLGINLPENLVTARLMTSRYVDALLLPREREILIAGLWHITGFNQQPEFIQKLSKDGTSYTLSNKLALFVNAITSFSNAPLVGIFYIGIFISLLSLVSIFLLVILWTFFQRPLSGWTSIMASLWLIGGLIISFIGIIGVYLAKVFSESKQRPYTIIRDIYGRKHK